MICSCKAFLMCCQWLLVCIQGSPQLSTSYQPYHQQVALAVQKLVAFHSLLLFAPVKAATQWGIADNSLDLHPHPRHHFHADENPAKEIL